MLVSLNQREKVELRQRLKDKTVLSATTENFLVASSRKSSWDGYVHPSSLDWNSAVDTQMKSLRKEFVPSVFTLKRMAVGSIIHNYIQHLQHESFFAGKSHREVHITSDKLLFRGTPDQYGEHKHLGNVLIEYKSVSSYQRDKTFADKVLKRMIQADAWENLNEKDREEAYNRLCVKYVDYANPETNHLTQAFTYAFIMKREFGFFPDHICVCYVRKESLDTMEFWYPVKDHQDLLRKAVDNYKAVLEATVADPLGKEMRRKWRSRKEEDTTVGVATQNSP